jgi:transposase
LLWRCAPFVRQAVPRRVLCERVHKYLPELFSFIADPCVPLQNKAAERSVRPVAVHRTISGGTRSAARTLTRTTLWPLLEMRMLQGMRALDGWIDFPASAGRRPGLNLYAGCPDGDMFCVKG